jgi:LPS-assembly protein
MNATTSPPEPVDKSKETLITADNMKSDQNTNTVIAIGHVEIARGNYVLHADKVTYFQKTGVMRAEGHVAMLTPSGEVQFSDKQDITGDMKQAFAENVGILFSDNSRLIAPTVQRYEGRYTVADHGLYTSCNVCVENPDNPPLWQMRADQMVHDNVEHEIYYHNATLDFDNTPVFYTPYFSAPDPTVDRRQGFLAPTPGFNSKLGGFLKVPYYFDIAPDMDATLTPTFSEKDILQLGGELRKRFDNGYAQFSGSFTHADLINEYGQDLGEQWRGHLFGNVLFNLDNVWRAGSDIQFASDKTYLPLYNYTGLNELTNRFYLEGFKGRDYAVVNSYYFEDLRPGTTIAQPLILPQASFSALGEPGQTWGGRWSMNGNMLVTTRDNANQGLGQQGPDTRRLYYDAGWQRQFISNTGLVTTLDGMARVDTESADNVTNPDGSGENFDNVLVAHQFEQADATMRYPIARRGDGYGQLVEPLISLTAAPAIHRDSHQPIEDSNDVQFDETNLFAANRFTGYDLIEGGSRATYGLRHAITGDGGARIDMFGGASYDFNRNTDFPATSGLQTKASDYVGRVEFVPIDWFLFNYGFRLDQSNLSPERQDALLSVGEPIFRPFIHYISGYVYDTTNITSTTPGYFTGDAGTLTDSKEVIIGFDSHFDKYYGLHIDHTQVFAPQPGPRSTTAILSYTDECYIFAVSLTQDDLTGVNVSTGTSVMFHMFFKNVGGVHSDAYSPAHDAYPTEFRETE